MELHHQASTVKLFLRGTLGDYRSRVRSSQMSVAVHAGFERGADRFRALYLLLAALSRASAADEIHDAALTSLIGTTAADGAGILVWDDDGVLRLKASRGVFPSISRVLLQASHHGREGLWARTPWWCPMCCWMRVSRHTGKPRSRKAFAAWHSYHSRWRPVSSASSFCPMRRRMRCTAEVLEIAEAIAAHVALATERKRG